MARLNYSATIDEMEQASGSCLTVANVAVDDGEIIKAAFFYGASAGIDQLLMLGKPEDAHLRVGHRYRAFDKEVMSGD